MELMRGHREGSLFQRKSGPGKGRWVAVVSMRDGRRASRWAKTRDEAKAELVELLRLRDAGAPLTGRVRLGEFLERWVSDGTRDMAPATRRKHEAAIRVHLVPELGHIRLSELRPDDVGLALRRTASAGLGPQSVRHLRATLRRSLADAVRDGLVSRNAAALAKAPPLKHTERTILDAAQARILIESTRTTRYGPLWTILVTTGLRISEALGLAWSAVDFGETPRHDSASRVSGTSPCRNGPTSGASLTVRHQLARIPGKRVAGRRIPGEWVRRPPKTAKGRRTIPLTPLGVEALRAQRAMQREWRFGDGGLGDRGERAHRSGGGDGDRVGAPESVRGPDLTPLPIDGLVFTSPTGHPLHETNTLAALHRDLHAAGLPRVTQHDLRHSCATLLYSMGVPLETIADILGHSSSRITSDLYRHRVADLQQAASDAMQRALG